MKMVTLLSKGWIWVLSFNILNWVLEKGIMEQKGWSFGGTGKLGDKLWWGKVVNGGWSMGRVYQVFGSVKVWGSWRKRLLVVWIVAGALGSLWIFTYLNSKTTYKRQETLSSMCEERVRMLQDQFNVSMNHVHALAILVSTFHHGKRPSAIDQKTFAQYTARTAFERPLTSGVAYAQKVLHSEREEFEKQQGWTIKRMIEDEQNPVREDGFAEFQEVSPVHEEYAPVIFAQETVEHVISIDMLSGKEDRENILRARASGRGVLTAPFKLLKSNRLGVILTFAVYSKELPSNATPMERIEESIGYIGGIFDIGSLVDKLLHQLASTQTILVNVYDTTNASNPINMYGPSVLDNRLCHVSSIYFGDPFRQYEMHCRFNQKRPPIPWFAIITSLAAFVIEVLIGYIFYAAVARIVKVEDDYHEMMALKVRAEAADIAKSQFLATVSHEIRTPMTGVLGMLDQLMDTSLDATQQDYVRTAQASGKALVSLINQVLDQAKIESGNVELESVHFDLRGVLDEVLSLFSGKSQEKGIELAVYVSEKVPRVIVGDPCRFRQIITNLVGNSVKFTEKGHIFVSVHLVEEVRNSVEVYAEPLYEDGTRMSSFSSHNTLSGFPVVDKRRSWRNFKSFTSETPTYNQKSSSPDVINLLVSVEDTGIGILPEAQARVFTPFMQADSSTSRIHGGTGIGLSISKRFIELMKGEIGFVSEPRVGSTFSFTAVFSKGQANQKEPKAHHQQNGDDLAIPEIQKLSALVIDTRPTRADVTKYHLQRLSIEVEVSCDVHQAFTRVAKGGARHIDFVLIEKEIWIEKSDILSAAFSTKATGTNGRHVPPKLFILASSIDYKGVSAARSSGCEIQQIMKPLRANMLATFLRGAMVVGERGNRGPITSLKSKLRGKKILVVDDNPVNLIVAASMLKKYGADVECVDSGKRAITELTPPHTFDACFMDIQMPEIDGFKATRRIRDMEDRANQALKGHGNVSHWHIPILAMTADVIQATYDQCRKCGMDGYVSKPFDESQLYGEVTKFFPLNPSSGQ